MKMRKKQQGAVLLIALIFLLIISIITISSVQESNLTEQIVGDTYDQNITFQVAESALRKVEKNLENKYALIYSQEVAVNPYIDNSLILGNNIANSRSVKATEYSVRRLKQPRQLDIQGLQNLQLAGGSSLAAGEEMILDFALAEIEVRSYGRDPNNQVALKSIIFIEE